MVSAIHDKNKSIINKPLSSLSAIVLVTSIIFTASISSFTNSVSAQPQEPRLGPRAGMPSNATSDMSDISQDGQLPSEPGEEPGSIPGTEIDGQQLQQQQQSPMTLGNTTATTTTGLEADREQYLSAWENSNFHSAFDTFVNVGFDRPDVSYGIYEEHGSNIYRPEDTIVLYVEPAGFSHRPVIDAQGNQLYFVNITGSIQIADSQGNELMSIEDIEPFEITSHRRNTEVAMTLGIEQAEPFPEGDYIFTYTLTDGNTGESFDIVKDVTIGEVFEVR